MSKNTNENWSIFKIRMQLLKIWFLKNLGLFIKVGIVIIIVLFLTNVIGSESFLVQVLGIDELEGAFDQNNIQGIESAIAAVISAAISIAYFMKKSKAIAIDDIKSRELKIALIKAKLYFDEDGKLCKRAEELTQLDIDGDGKIGDVNVEDIKSESLVSGTKTAIGELTTILTAKIDPNATENVVQESQLNSELDTSDVITTEKLYTEDLGAPVVEETIDNEKTLNDKISELSKTESSLIESTTTQTASSVESTEEKKLSFFGELFRALKLAFKEPKINDNMEKKKEKKHKDISESTEHKKHSKVEVVSTETDDNIPIIETTSTSESNTSDHSNNTQSGETTILSDSKAELETKTANEKKIDDILNSI